VSEESKNEIERMGVFKNELTIADEDVVDMVSRSYLRKIRNAEREAVINRNKENDRSSEANNAFRKSIAESGQIIYKKFIKGLIASLGKAGFKKIILRATPSEYRESGDSSGTGPLVYTHISVEWDQGSLAHRLSRELTKEEKELQDTAAKASKAALEFERYIADLKARRAEVTELAGDARGAIAEHHLQAKDPAMVKKLKAVMEQDDYTLPAPPKPSK
jgi:hypothetical protein